MPTTTANFADFELTPSRLSVAALAVCYLSAAGLLLFAWFRSSLPLPVVLCCLEALIHEWLNLTVGCYSLRGRFAVSTSGDVIWQQKKWQILRVKICTRYFILLRIRCVGKVRWLLVCHDACSESSYRALSLLCCSSVNFSPDR